MRKHLTDSYHCILYPVIAVAAFVSFDIFNKRLLYCILYCIYLRIHSQLVFIVSLPDKFPNCWSPSPFFHSSFFSSHWISFACLLYDLHLFDRPFTYLLFMRVSRGREDKAAELKEWRGIRLSVDATMVTVELATAVMEMARVVGVEEAMTNATL